MRNLVFIVCSLLVLSLVAISANIVRAYPLSSRQPQPSHIAQAKADEAEAIKSLREILSEAKELTEDKIIRDGLIPGVELKLDELEKLLAQPGKEKEALYLKHKISSELELVYQCLKEEAAQDKIYNAMDVLWRLVALEGGKEAVLNHLLPQLHEALRGSKYVKGVDAEEKIRALIKKVEELQEKMKEPGKEQEVSSLISDLRSDITRLYEELEVENGDDSNVRSIVGRLVGVDVKLGRLELMEFMSEFGKALAPAPAPAETAPPAEEIEKQPGYTVKVLSGATSGNAGLQPGSYSTVINIRNPSDKEITIRIKFIEAKSITDQTPGKKSDFKELKLKEDGVFKVIDSDIRNIISPPGSGGEMISPFRFIDGFAVIRAQAPLSVVAVYTAQMPAGSSFHMEVCSPDSASYLSGTPSSVPAATSPTSVLPPPTKATVPPAKPATTTEIAPPPAVKTETGFGQIMISPLYARNVIGTTHAVTVRVLDTSGKPAPNVKIRVRMGGAHTGAIELVTDADGKGGYYYVGRNIGNDTIVASVDSLSAIATKGWYSPGAQQPPSSPTQVTPAPTTGPAAVTPPGE